MENNAKKETPRTDKQMEEMRKYNKEVQDILEDPNLQVHEKLIKAVEIASKYKINEK